MHDNNAQQNEKLSVISDAERASISRGLQNVDLRKRFKLSS